MTSTKDHRKVVFVGLKCFTNKGEIIIMQNNIDVDTNEHLNSRYIQSFLDEYGFYDNEIFDGENFCIWMEEM
ncbi:hypothetical protein TUST1-10_01060 [Vibrio phage ICP1_2004_A]|nr:hypothetical protein TUST1-191_01070 [Vibrio phage ICP1_2006_D]ADX88487.1 hypothetical protein TUST1-182_01070 [Vibrio phage ICP1_2006_C]ADX88711.1 hypothetical protein TUST1-159_01055 [Vibrio phage ICP1_2006_B]ADX88937.1 hypothetical protein TUST1-17_01055 [Vibrio phage ICP1_2006_A]ADX89167.1 hypothetical protein TUST1-15_01075 [Vibrio phage ICP1_2005_A]ADX89397.1 hypothetical protein TUST1-2_01085 [Vibrio phage ICP1_2001_A]ADX89624.1 hypothetical protein TUST1-10_01060 [Vibrio phage ICP1